MRNFVYAAALLLLWGAYGCAPAVVGAGAAGAYKVTTDERTTGDMMDDATISAKINAEMVKDKIVKARKIDIDTVDGVVVLSGIVETAREASRAVEIARSVPGVKSVRNNILIGSRTWGRAVDDTQIGMKIKTALIGEPGIRSLNIDVDVYNGVVVLTGLVDTAQQKERAAEIARSTKGAVSVINNLLLKQ